MASRALAHSPMRAACARRLLRLRSPATRVQRHPHPQRSSSSASAPRTPEGFIDFDAMDGLFAFVPELANDKPALVAQSRETLRQMGRLDDSVRLVLPPDASPTLARLGLASLRKAAVVEIHNPSARNALSGKMMAELADIVTRLEDPVVHRDLNTVVLTGTDGWFCAGADLRVAQKQLTSNEAGTAMGALMVDTLTRFRRLPLVSFAIIEGGAYGGGAELATSCDYRLVEANAVIQFVQARMATKSSADDAVKLGLADLVFDAKREASASKILDFVAAFDEVASEVLHGQKRVITNADDVSLDDLVDYEHSVFASLWGGPANLRALESFKKKTPSPKAQE